MYEGEERGDRIHGNRSEGPKAAARWVEGQKPSPCTAQVVPGDHWDLQRVKDIRSDLGKEGLLTMRKDATVVS